MVAWQMRARLPPMSLWQRRRYRQREYPVRIDLFVPCHEWRELGGLPYQWRSVAAAVQEHTVPEGSDHDLILQGPFVEGLLQPLCRPFEGAGSHPKA